MVHVLDVFRQFTKFVQYRNRVTLAYIPSMLDELVTRIAPGSFRERLQNISLAVYAQVEALQVRLINSLRVRFRDIFDDSSLALAAAMLLPGANRFTFLNFDVTEEQLERSEEHTSELQSLMRILYAVFCLN